MSSRFKSRKHAAILLTTYHLPLVEHHGWHFFKHERSRSPNGAKAESTNSNCATVPIGHTVRRLKTRIRKHEAVFRKKTPKKPQFAAHLLDAGHSLTSPFSVRLRHASNNETLILWVFQNSQHIIIIINSCVLHCPEASSQSRVCG